MPVYNKSPIHLPNHGFPIGKQDCKSRPAHIHALFGGMAHQAGAIKSRPSFLGLLTTVLTGCIVIRPEG